MYPSEPEQAKLSSRPMSEAAPSNLAAVQGITVGHWTDSQTATGCTVTLAPPGGMRAACAARGRASGTRELDALDPRHLVGHIDAVLLTGGSAFGLGAADGVMRWLKERGRGFPVGPAGVVPIVPTAVIFDFDLAPGSKADRWPGADDAYRACAAAGTEIAEGSVGAGTGATVGKALGPRGAMKGGVGTWAARAGDVVVGALVVLNAVGNVLDANGRVLAGARGADGRFVDVLGYLAQGGAPFDRGGGAGRNTTLAVVATNARLDRVALQALAHAAGTRSPGASCPTPRRSTATSCSRSAPPRCRRPRRSRRKRSPRSRCRRRSSGRCASRAGRATSRDSRTTGRDERPSRTRHRRRRPQVGPRHAARCVRSRSAARRARGLHHEPRRTRRLASHRRRRALGRRHPAAPRFLGGRRAGGSGHGGRGAAGARAAGERRSRERGAAR